MRLRYLGWVLYFNTIFAPMFTGIIEQLGTVVDVQKQDTNVVFTLEAAMASELKVDQSVAHNGVCLTVVDLLPKHMYKVVAIAQTLAVTNLQFWHVGTLVNLERCLPVNGRYDGHIVQGHVDATAVLAKIEDMQGSYNLFFEHKEQAGITVSKGSITVNGVSLTVVNSSPTSFSVSIIPYTWQHTNLQQLRVGDTVNIEFDVIAKYVQKLLANAIK